MSEEVKKVLANCAQNFSDAEKLQARTNIGAIGGVKVYDGSTTQELVPDAEGKVTVDLSEAGKVQSDWAETNSNEASYIRNKPDLSQYATLEDLENMTGVFIGVYTGTEATTTPFADFYAAHLEGKALFLKREIDGTEYLFGADDVSATAIRFTRTIGSVESNAYGTVKSYMAEIVKDEEEDVWAFYEKQLGDDQVQSDWMEADSSKKSFIRNKPNLATVATSGSYNDLTDKPSIPDPQVQSDWAEADNTKVDYIKNKPNLATVATSGSYNDLSDKPSIPAAQVQSDWTEEDSADPSFILHKPTLATVATSGSYNDLEDKPTIPAAQVQSDWNQSDSGAVDYIKNKPAPMETKPLVAGTNIEFVSGNDSVTINANATRIETRSAPYSTAVELSKMGIYDPGQDYGSVVKDTGGNTIGFLAPKHYGEADQGKVLTVVSDNGYKMEWRPAPQAGMDLKVLTQEQVDIESGTGDYQLTIVDGKAYDLTLKADRGVQLVTVSESTVHTILAIHNNDTATCGGVHLRWRDETLEQHDIYLMLYDEPASRTYYFDVYIKKVVVNGTPYAIARVSDYPCAYRDGYTNGYSNDNINFIGRNY